MEECWFSRSNAEATSLGNVDARIERCEVGSNNILNVLVNIYQNHAWRIHKRLSKAILCKFTQCKGIYLSKSKCKFNGVKQIVALLCVYVYLSQIKSK